MKLSVDDFKSMYSPPSYGLMMIYKGEYYGFVIGKSTFELNNVSIITEKSNVSDWFYIIKQSLKPNDILLINPAASVFPVNFNSPKCPVTITGYRAVGPNIIAEFVRTL